MKDLKKFIDRVNKGVYKKMIKSERVGVRVTL